jgi:hypothetical protein
VEEREAVGGADGATEDAGEGEALVERIICSKLGDWGKGPLEDGF